MSSSSRLSLDSTFMSSSRMDHFESFINAFFKEGIRLVSLNIFESL